MNAKLLLKTIFIIAVFLLVIVMGMNNRQPVRFTMPLVLPRPQELPAALMYFAFFAVGFISGTVISGGKKGGSTAKPKADK
jgi:uncharacterized membrane protein YciS (DUF1049 family)